MGALQRITKPTGWLKLPKFQRSARSRAIDAAIREDERADPYAYAIFAPKALPFLMVAMSSSIMVGLLVPATHGLPFLVTAATVGIATNDRRILFLRRLKKGVAQGPAVEALAANRRSNETRAALEASTVPTDDSLTRFTSNEHLDY